MNAGSTGEVVGAGSTGRFERPGVVHRRLFFALWPDVRQRTSLAHAARKAIKANGVRAVPNGNLHLTLAFLGAVPERRIPEVAAIARAVAAAFPADSVPLRFTFDRLEHWKKPQVICATVGAGALEGPTTLAEALRIPLVEVGLAPDLKSLESTASLPAVHFRPHVTLARKVARPGTPLDIETVLWSFEEFVLVESRTEPSGAVYRVLESFPLGYSAASR